MKKECSFVCITLTIPQFDAIQSTICAGVIQRVTLTCLNAEVKAPKYATTPADINTSPVKLLYFSPSSVAA